MAGRWLRPDPRSRSGTARCVACQATLSPRGEKTSLMPSRARSRGATPRSGSQAARRLPHPMRESSRFANTESARGRALRRCRSPASPGSGRGNLLVEPHRVPTRVEGSGREQKLLAAGPPGETISSCPLGRRYALLVTTLRIHDHRYRKCQRSPDFARRRSDLPAVRRPARSRR